jgi:hypothetical protein
MQVFSSDVNGWRWNHYNAPPIVNSAPAANEVQAEQEKTKEDAVVSSYLTKIGVKYDDK